MASHKELQSRAAAEVRADFDRHHHELLRSQGQQFAASWVQRTREIESYAVNRAEAIKQHEADIKAIDKREKRASVELSMKHSTICERVSALTKKGRDRQEQERQGLAGGFEAQRMKKHRDLAALQERQAQNEQKARLRYGQEHKVMREGHLADRSKQRVWQDGNRPRLVRERVTAHRQDAARTLRQDRQKQREPLTRTFNQTRQPPGQERAPLSRAFHR
jgi:hypothetical protein